jgi:hypothetical protein
MPFYGLPVQSHYVETVIQLDRFSNHTLFLTIRLCRATHIDWGNGYPVNGEKGFAALVCRRAFGMAVAE